MTSSTFTTEFGHELEVERHQWLRRRFLWYAGVMILLTSAWLLIWGAGLAAIRAGNRTLGTEVLELDTQSLSIIEGGATIALGLVSLAMYIWAFVHVYRKSVGGPGLNRLAVRLLVAAGVLSLITLVVSAEVRANLAARPQPAQRREDSPVGMAGTGPVAAELATDKATLNGTGDASRPVEYGAMPEVRSRSRSDDAGGPLDPLAMASANERARSARTSTIIGAGLWQIFAYHFFACLFFPWTPRESARPLMPLLGLNALVIVAYIALGVSLTAGLVSIALSPLVGVPGAAICWWRHSVFRDRFTNQMLRGRYLEVRRELVDARRIHESLFPRPLTEGAFRFDYVYRPMRQIGGDYLFGRVTGEANSGAHAFNLVLMDVTGHGIAAALTVNRLYGELERLYAERPDASPGEILRSLNRYIHLTLASHSLYVTALCVRVNLERDTLDYASGGHPPAFLLGVDGSIEELASTALVLGAAADEDFENEEQTRTFRKGDTLLAYTDGVIEARNAQGRMIRVEGLSSMLATLVRRGGHHRTGPLLRHVLEMVDGHQFGPQTDDVLVVELARGVATTEPSRPNLTGPRTKGVRA
ncbi:MAG: serine/threonine-protein phosphatase [Phycisphaerae bacterium]|nr:serine/threonine-protein phosphatase [Phycisphaerae bacterium]